MTCGRKLLTLVENPGHTLIMNGVQHDMIRRIPVVQQEWCPPQALSECQRSMALLALISAALLQGVAAHAQPFRGSLEPF